MNSSNSSVSAVLHTYWVDGQSMLQKCTIDIETGIVTPTEFNEDEIYRTDVEETYVKLSWLPIHVEEDAFGNQVVANPADLNSINKIVNEISEEEIPEFLNPEGYIAYFNKPGMNTLFSYEYRDASNYKTSASVIIPGVIQPEQINLIYSNLLKEDDTRDFLPLQVGLKALCPMQTDHHYDPDIDHPLHTITELSLTPDAPTNDINLIDFANKFAGITPEGWDFESFGN